ncbi:hypothetical protein [Nocardia sp. NPDC051832]|uniref:hypothetical protein n=1 Tax=Nocardia sp. NPDC051832 TaxID=3155673 RepID=UPI0034343ECF
MRNQLQNTVLDNNDQAQNRAARRGKGKAVRSIQPTGRLNTSRRPSAAPRRSAY